MENAITKKDSKTELVFILDRSGSMEGLESDTIGGYNGMLEKQKSEEGTVYLSTVLFDNSYELIHNRVSLNEAKPLTANEYFVRGSTALLDAIGKTIDSLSKKITKMNKCDRPDNVLIVITTDGMENSSREYSLERVKDMIEHQTAEHGWEFLFLGANIDAVDVAQSMGICCDNAVQFNNDSVGIESNYDAMCATITNLRQYNKIDKNWKKNIEKDFVNRGKKK